ncbi:MAG: flagellar motor protein MotB [Alphaproteobacteria bacterium]|nr:flagellar motor protein MotB [Alphaproteobacteria bacterium]
MADQPIIIIRKRRKQQHAAHHGGAWKVAYADFVTAMMSFFLLLWLLNVTTDIQRKGIADYFAPASVSKSESGAGGIFGGQTITVSGAEVNDSSPPTTQDVTIPTIGQGEQGDEDTKGQSQNSDNGKATEGADAKKPNDKGTDTSGAGATKEEQAVAAAMQAEEENFKKAEETLKQAIMSSPELQAFANQIVIDRTPEGLRIQIIDRDKFSMFPSGGAVPYERGRDLLMLVGKVIARLPNKISVTGHTDGTPFPIGSGRDNWTLSTERANVSREYLVQAGVNENSVARVSGLADRDPFAPDPKDPRNRRISIVLLRQSLAPAPAAPAAPAGAGMDDAAPAATPIVPTPNR